MSERSENDEEVVQGRRVVVEQRRLRRRDGRIEVREMVVHPGSVLIVPILADGRIVLIRNRRFTIERTLLELPAGTREGDEPFAICAARELEEETGYRADSLRELLAFYPAPGTSDERMHVFVAHGLTATAQRLDQTEQIEVEPLPPREVLARIREGVIEDAKTIAAMLYYAAWGDSG